MSLLKEKESGRAQPPPRESSKRVASAYDALASQDGWRAKRDADKERPALAKSEQETTDGHCQGLVNAYWSRSSKRADAQATTERDASRRLVEGLSA